MKIFLFRLAKFIILRVLDQTAVTFYPGVSI
jgi:hypothetical protein